MQHEKKIRELLLFQGFTDIPKEMALQHMIYEHLWQAESNGHTCRTASQILVNCVKFALRYTIGGGLRDDQLSQGYISENLDPRIFTRLPDGFIALRSIAEDAEIAAKFLRGCKIILPATVGASVTEGLNEGQSSAVNGIVMSATGVLTGGPGCGKTYTLSRLLDVAESAGVPIIQCAFTGKAAQRMQESTGRPASTIHALVQRKDIPTEALVVIDEVSMVSEKTLAMLARKLIGSRIQLIAVGDENQLPPIGGGNVLRDLKAVFPVFALSAPMRFGNKGALALSAARICAGELPLDDTTSKDDFEWFKSDSYKSTNRIVEWGTRCYQKHGADFMILTATNGHRDQINKMIQMALGRSGDHLLGTGDMFFKSDRIMAKVNRYTPGAGMKYSNGQFGAVLTANDKGMEIQFDTSPDESLWVPAGEVEDFTLSYSCTIHKSQGAEASRVLVAANRIEGRPSFINRNLVYTGITRGRQKVILVALESEMGRIVNTTDAEHRESCLSRYL